VGHVAVAYGKRYWKSGDEVFLNRIQVYRVTTGEEVLSESNRGIQGFGFQPGTDRLYVLTSGEENQLRFFDRDTWQETWRHSTSHAPAYGMAMSRTGQEIAIGLRDSRVEFWKLSDIQADKP
jgi:WD40 repeat protein